MNHYIRRIISFALTVSIIIVSIFMHPIFSFAFSPDEFIGNLSWDKMTTSEKWALTWNFSVAELRALYTGDFESYLNGMSAMEEYKSNHDPDDFVNDDGMTIPADFVALIKQALLEYYEETNGFWIIATPKYNELNVSDFARKPQYDTIKNLALEKGLIAVNGFNAMYVSDLTCISEGYVFINRSNSYNPYTSTQPCWVDLYSPDWERKSKWTRFFDFTQGAPAFSSFESGVDVKELVESGQKNTGVHQVFSPNYGLLSGYKAIYSSTMSISGFQMASLVSSDGRRVRVYKSLDAYKLYSVDQRSVYFGKGFYDYEPSDITATWDDIAHTVNHMDDILQQLLDKIDESTDESTIEDLLQQILDAINGGGSDDNDNGGGSDIDIPSGFFDSIEGYFDSVLGYLESILYEIQNLEWLTWESNVDEEHSDLFDLLDKIWDDPENGSQEVADELSMSFGDLATGITKKFPFSIPWDVYALFRVFAGVDPPQTQSVSVYTLSGRESVTYNTVSSDTAVYSVDSRGNAHDAPYFELPLVIASFGIEEYIIVDLKDFQSLSTLSRTMLSLLFGVFLMKFTIKVIDLFKGGTDT